MMRVHRASRLRSAGGVAALAAFAAAGFAFGSARPPAPAAAFPYAAAEPAPAAAPAAPVRLAAAEAPAPTIVVTGRRSGRAAASPASRLEKAPMSFASAEAPAPLPTTLASMTMVLRHLPRPAVAPRAAPHPAPAALAASLAEGAHVEVHGRVYRLTASGAEARFFVVGERLTAEQAAELREAVTKAVAERRKVKFRRERSGGGGSGDGLFDINVQTLVKGEEGR